MLTVLKTDNYPEAVDHLREIKNPDYPKLLSDLAEAGESSAFFSIIKHYGHLKEFSKVDYSALALKLIERTNDLYTVYSKIQMFRRLNKEVFRKLLSQKGDYHSWLVEGLDAGVFDGLEAEDYNALALKLLEGGSEGGYTLSESLEHFFFLNEEVARKLIEQGYARKVRKHETAFDESVNLNVLLKKAG